MIHSKVHISNLKKQTQAWCVPNNSVCSFAPPPPFYLINSITYQKQSKIYTPTDFPLTNESCYHTLSSARSFMPWRGSFNKMASSSYHPFYLILSPMAYLFSISSLLSFLFYLIARKDGHILLPTSFVGVSLFLGQLPKTKNAYQFLSIN